MDSINSVQTPAFRKVYRMTKGWKILYLALILFILALGLGTIFLIALDPPTPSNPMDLVIAILVVVLFYGLFIALLVFTSYSRRLIITPEGVEYNDGTFRLYTTWDNIDSIGEMPAGVTVSTALILLEPGEYSIWRIPFMRFLARKANYNRNILLRMFAPKFSGSELEQDIKRFAPHLFGLSTAPELDITLESSKGPGSPITQVRDEKYRKIGGWLIPLVIWLVFMVVVMVVQLFTVQIPSLGMIWVGKVWPQITTPGAKLYSPLPRTIMLSEVIAVIVFIVLALYALVLFFQKKKRFRYIAIWFMVSSILFSLIDYLALTYLDATKHLGLDLRSPTSPLLLLLVIYLQRSERVRKTFVN